MEIKFKRDTSFRKQFFVPESFAHPAKMDAQLLIWIAEHYTEAGETILDPMAGMGTTMLACILGRDVVLVELEEKFCKMMRDNWEQVKMRPQLGSAMGDCQIIKGDARQLEGLVDKIVTSPPYGHRSIAGEGITAEKFGTIKYSDETVGFEERRDKKTGRFNPYPFGNIGNLPYGEIDKCIFSPPYADLSTCQETSKNEIERRIKKGIQGAVVTEDGKYMTGGGHRQERYSEDTKNVGNLPYGQIDKIVTSPPFADSSLSSQSILDKYPELAGKGGGIVTGSYDEVEINNKSIGGSRTKQSISERASRRNIGNINIWSGHKKQIIMDSYLEAMLQVYQQCYKVLKTQGLMILVTKNFIRNKQVVRLDEDTIKLCEQAGFSFVERHYRELPSQSFWRVIYHQKYPEVEQIKNEDVLVFRKLTIHITPKC